MGRDTDHVIALGRTTAALSSCSGPGKFVNAAREAHDRVEMDLQRWVLVYIATVTGECSDTLDLRAPMALHDFDSLDAVEMAFEFEKAFECRVDPEIFMNGAQTVAGLIEALNEVRLNS